MERDNPVNDDIVLTAISTHTLTWSVTIIPLKNYSMTENFNSHAHVERDLLGVWDFEGVYSFQLTRSRGA